jgi:hypothetical protein
MQGHDKTRLTIHKYGDDDRVPNPGDLLITSTIGDPSSLVTEVGFLIAGRDMALFAREANAAVLEYESNKQWLSAPVSKRGAA